MEPKPKIERGIIMENEIMNYVENEVMENENIVSEVAPDGTLKGVAIGAGLVAAGYGAYKLGRKLWNKFKAKRAAKKDIPEDITEDKIDEIPE